MTRLTHLLTALALTCAFVAAAVVACGGQPITPREMPPLAPRPERVDPTALPVPTETDPGTSPIDARPALPSPISALASPASMTLTPATQRVDAAPPDAGAGHADAAGPADAAGGPTDAPGGPADARGAVDARSPVVPSDASVDSSMPLLPPIPDGNLPADSRLAPF